MLIFVFVKIGRSAPGAMLMETEYQVSKTLRLCVIADNSLTQFSLIQRLLHPLNLDVAMWLFHKFLQGQASRLLELIKITALMFTFPLILIFVVSERSMEPLVQLILIHYLQVFLV